MEQSTIAIIIIVIAIISFILERIPLSVTAMMAALAMGLFGIIEIKAVYADFGSLACIMVASMMIVGNSAFENGLAQAMGRRLMKTGIGNNETLFLFSLMVSAMILSSFLSNSAVVAMFIPLIASMVSRSNGKILNKNILLAVGMGASAGGMNTLSGSTPQMVAQGMLMNTEGLEPMGFFDLAAVGVPICILMVIYFLTIGRTIQNKVLTFDDVVPGDNTSGNEEEVQYVKWKQVLTGIILVACICGFVSGVWNLAIVASLGATALVATGCIDFKKAVMGIDWNTIVILAASQAFAKGLDSSGAGILIANWILDIFGGELASPFTIIAVLITVTAILTNFMSNVAVAAMIIPIAISLAFALGSNPQTFVMAIAIACQLSTASPIGSPCVTQTLVGGYKYMHYVKIGLPITAIQVVAAIFLVDYVWGV